MAAPRRAKPHEAARAFGVMRPFVLAAGAATSIAATLRSLLRLRRPPRLAVLGSAATLLYALVLRPWHLRWGAEPGDVKKPLPGDEHLPHEGTEILHAVTIDAPLEDVWPWLAQIGQDRAGFYSYECLENLAGCEMRNADAVHPEWQHREPGERVLLHPALGMEVTVFEPGRAIGLKNWGNFATAGEPKRP